MATDEASTLRAQIRRTVDFPPTACGDYFLKHFSVSDDNDDMINSWREEVEFLKAEVRSMFKAADDRPSQLLNMIDSIQRMGIACHLHGEIETAVGHIYNTFQNSDNVEDLFTVALAFRLLRQHRYKVSSDVFQKFKDERSNIFRENLTEDVRGMLSLYEASYLSVHGEEILDEALVFSKNYLQSIVNHLKSPLLDLVSHALRWPVHRALPCKEALDYISIYEKEEERSEALLKLAKLNFNIVQKSRQDELGVITKWWIDLDLQEKLPYGRDRMMECFFWALGVLPEAELQYALGRRMLSKFYSVTVFIDDTYDVHGTIDELELFTKVNIERSDIRMKDELPDYMKILFQTVLNLYDEMEQETTREGRPFCVKFAKEAMKNQLRAYINEARWFNMGYVPIFEDYLSNGVFSSAYPLGMIISTCGMGEIATKEVLDWLLTMPEIVYASSAICRLIDDIRTHEFEQERGHVVSAVECYMNQYGVSQRHAVEELEKRITSLWKDINEELFRPNDVPVPILTSILNYARILEVVYERGGGFTFSKDVLADIITGLLVEPMVV